MAISLRFVVILALCFALPAVLAQDDREAEQVELQPAFNVPAQAPEFPHELERQVDDVVRTPPNVIAEAPELPREDERQADDVVRTPPTGEAPEYSHEGGDHNGGDAVQYPDGYLSLAPSTSGNGVFGVCKKICRKAKTRVKGNYNELKKCVKKCAAKLSPNVIAEAPELPRQDERQEDDVVRTPPSGEASQYSHEGGDHDDKDGGDTVQYPDGYLSLAPSPSGNGVFGVCKRICRKAKTRVKRNYTELKKCVKKCAAKLSPNVIAEAPELPPEDERQADDVVRTPPAGEAPEYSHEGGDHNGVDAVQYPDGYLSLAPSPSGNGVFDVCKRICRKAKTLVKGNYTELKKCSKKCAEEIPALPVF